MRSAVTDELIGRSPCLIAGAGLERPPERPVATIAEVDALAGAITDRLRALVLLATWCSLRRGELLGLRQSAIDIRKGTVRIENVLNQLQHGQLEFGPPKTQAGIRTVAIPPHIRQEILVHLKKYVGEDPDALVFSGVKGGPLRPHVLQKEWNEAKRSVGLEQFHLHDLRHTGNTWAAATGASTKELMGRMGHADERTALIYQHATEERDQVIAKALSGLAKDAKVTSIKRPKKGRPNQMWDKCGMEPGADSEPQTKKAS
jgi:integrase